MPVPGLAGRLSIALDRLEVGQREAARRAGVTHAALHRALKEDSEPSAELLWRVADALGLSLEWLFRESGPMVREAAPGAAEPEAAAMAFRQVAGIATELARAAEARASGEVTSPDADELAATIQALEAAARRAAAAGAERPATG